MEQQELKGNVINSEFAKNIGLNGRLPVFGTEPVFAKQPVTDDDGNELFEENGNPITELVETGERKVQTGTREVKLKLVPGLNTVSGDQMDMLRQNDAFEMYCSMQQMSIVQYDEPTDSGDEELPNPEEISDIDISQMTVAAAGKVIASAATMVLLDQFQLQEDEGKQRKGVFAHLVTQRKLVQDIIEKQENAE